MITVSKYGKGSRYYGKLMTDTLPSEVKTIWYSRDEELPELPQHKWSWELETDLEHVERRELLAKILADAPLTDQQWLVVELVVIHEITFREIGEKLGCTGQRARDIYMKAMRILRRHQARITGIDGRYVYGEVTTWRYWKWVNDPSNFGIDESDERDEFVWSDDWWKKLTSSNDHEDRELVAWFYRWRGSRLAKNEGKT